MTRTYAITAATGFIGSRVASALLDAGHRVHALGRSAAKLAPLVARGATAHVGDLSDRAFVASACAGADAALLIVPPNATEPEFSRYFTSTGATHAHALEVAGVSHAIFVSCLGTHDPRFRGLVGLHADVEHVLDASAVPHLLHLRAPSFFENLFYFVPASRARGALCSPIAPDAALETVARRDVADAAIRRLLELDFGRREAAEVHGPVELSMARIAAIIEAELGRPFPAVHVPRDADIEALVGAGLGREFAELINDTWALFSRFGLLREREPSASSRGTTTMESFVKEVMRPALS